MRFFALLICILPFSGLAAQEMNTHLPVLRKLDAMRLPGADFSARVTMREGKPGSSTFTESVFRQYSRLRADAAGRKQLETLLVCDTPARDAGKMILFARSTCWFHTPQARRPTRMSAQQVATHALVADWINWSFADDFDHVRSGSEALTVTGTAHACTVLDLTPKPGVKNRASFMRCWMDAAGRLWKAEIYSSSRKLMRTVHLSHYETVLGAERASRLRIESSSKTEEVILDDVQKHSSAEDYFDPEKLPALVPVLTRPTATPR